MSDPRIAFEILGRPIQWYGVMFAAGFLAAVAHFAWLGKRTARRPGLGSDLGLWVMIGGVIGARAAFVFGNWDYFGSNPAEIIRIDQGGLVFYGGFVGGVIIYSIMVFVLRKETYQLHGQTRKENAWSLGDFAITALPLGHALGRLGCWLHGCCYGSITESPLGLPTKFYNDDGSLAETLVCYPVQLYEVGGLLILYVLTTLFYFRNRVPGRVFAAYMMAYGLLRFTNEFFRGDKSDRLNNVIASLDAAQLTALFSVVAGAILFFWLGKRSESPVANG